MPWNGSGTFSRVYDWTTDESNGTNPSATRFDAEDDSFATGINNCLTKDGQNSPTANISWGGNKITNLGTPTAAADAATKGYVDGATYLTSGVLGDLLDGLTVVTPATGDEILIADASDSTNAKMVTVQSILDLVATTLADGRLAPTGSVQAFAGSTAPTGWLLCHGQAISRTTYAALFTAISTTYGTGDGSTTFNLPDLRGRTVAGVDNMGGSAANRITNAVCGITGTTLGAAGGDQNMHGHTHTATVTDPGHTHTTADSYASNSGAGPNTLGYTGTSFRFNNAVNSATTGITVANSTTGSGSSQNVQPTMMLNYIIKT